MIVTEKRIQANRRNSAKSTGPRTARGKKKASGNGTSHGLSAKETMLSRAEKAAQRKELARWMDYYQPTSMGGD